jgi:hypothetical protein
MTRLDKSGEIKLEILILGVQKGRACNITLIGTGIIWWGILLLKLYIKGKNNKKNPGITKCRLLYN